MDQVGQGTFGRVFCVQMQDKYFAVKVSRAGDVFKEANEHEARMLEQIRGRQISPDFVESFDSDGHFFMVTEYCEQLLEDYLKQYRFGLTF